MQHTLRGLLILTLLACGGGHGGTVPSRIEPPSDGVAAFTVPPVDLSRIAIITPLGSLNPPGHTLPTDHVYLYQWNFDTNAGPRPTDMLPVVAPATGRVRFIMQEDGGDAKVTLICTEDFEYYLDHLVPIPGLAVGQVIRAGEPIGTTPPGATLDLGATDRRVSHTGFLNPARYPEPTLHYVSPWQYFVEPLRSQILARLRRHPSATDREGRIDFGVRGTLAGDWYEASLPADQTSAGRAGWPRTLAFVQDYYDPRLVRISIGGTIAPAGVWGIPANAPHPSTVTMASGAVAYPLTYQFGDTQYGILLAQLIAEDRIKVQVFVGRQGTEATFDAGAFTYVR
ncbi:MAG: hypothetical protein JNL26_01675 [Gemmatimonadetes bacterium]|nr:hypothetical protein [Gemmatimonadota bacterium]